MMVELEPAPRGVLAGVSPFCLLRVAALPYATLEAMRPARTLAALDDYDAAEAAAEAARPAVEDALHALVPRLEGAHALRRKVLDLRRDAHNGRASRLAQAQYDAIAALLGAPEREALARWNDAHHARTDALERAEALLVRERATLRTRLRAPLADPAFRRGLALANPMVARGAFNETEPPAKVRPTTLEASLLAYVSRAAAKTSPFSTFMLHTPIDVDLDAAGPGPHLHDLVAHADARINRGVFTRLYRRALRAAAPAGAVVLTLNPTFSRVDAQRAEALCAREIILAGRPWRDQRHANFRLHATVIDALIGGENAATWPQWRARIEAAGVDAKAAEAFVAKMVERGLLLLPPFTDVYDDAPGAALLERLRALGGPNAAAAVPLVEHAVAIASGLETTDAGERLTVIERVRALEDEALRALGDEPYEAYQNVILEDTYVTGARGALHADALPALTDLADFLSTQVAVSPDYRKLVNAFVARYGEGGVCDDVVPFVMRVGDRLVDIPEFGASPRPPENEYAALGATLGVTLHAQVVREDGGSPLLVANRVYDRVGWLTARFCGPPQSEYATLRERVGAWLERVYAPREPVDVAINGDCNDLQAHPRLTRRVLAWAGEPLRPDRDGVLDARRMRLRHDPASGMLEALDDAGTPVAPVYLGNALPTFQWGTLYAVSLLTQPYVLARPPLSPERLAASSDEPTFVPRLMHGRAVVRRAAWWVRARYLEERWFASAGARMLLDVRRDCERLGIPPVFFAQRRLDAGKSTTFVSQDMFNVDRKPSWIDSGNPFCLSVLQQLASRNEWVSFSEMLPGPDQLWTSVDGRPHVSEIHLEMLVSARR